MNGWLLLPWLIHCQLIQDSHGKRFDPSMVDPLMRRSTLDKNFMRFGRSSPSFTEEDEEVESHDASPGEETSKEDNFLRSMRGKDNFLRFGRGKQDNFMRFGKARNDNFMRFGRGKQDNFMRFGRGKQDNYMRFGRTIQQMDFPNGGGNRFSLDPESDITVEMRSERLNGNNLMRFGRGKQDNFMRFGRGKQDNYMRFGRGKQDNFMRFGRGKQDNYMRFGRTNQQMDGGKRFSLDPESDIPVELRSEKLNGNNFMRFGRGKQNNFMRFGRDKQDNSSDQATHFLFLGGQGKRFLVDPGSGITVAMRSGKMNGNNFMRFGRARQDSFMRFGKSPYDKLLDDSEEPKEDITYFSKLQNSLSNELHRDTRSKDFNLIRYSRHPHNKNDGFIRFGRNPQDQLENDLQNTDLIPQRIKRSVADSYEPPENNFISKLQEESDDEAFIPFTSLPNGLEEEYTNHMNQEDYNSRRKRSLSLESSTAAPPKEEDNSVVDFISAKLRVNTPQKPEYESSIISAGLPNVIVGPEFSLLPDLDPPSSLLKRGRPGDQSFLRLG